MKIIFNQIDPKAKIPIKGTPGSCCHDLVITKIGFIDKNKVEVSYGFSTEFSSKYKAVIVPRSSFTHKSWIMANSPGQIDSDYKQEWMSKFEAIPTFGISDEIGDTELRYDVFPYNIGDRVAQFYVEEVIDIDFYEGDVKIDNTTLHEKREGGFGSSDK